ncbi:MAG: acetate kinase [Rhodobacteraceae bacterium]|nr:acetate kinase [Paracoccaceae bacterium]
MTVGPILVLNAGSSSLKYASYDRPSLKLLTQGQENLAASGQSHSAALRAALAKIAKVSGPPSAVGHRIVHGGALNQPALITPEIRAKIEAAAPMAPLHNPPALKVIDAVQALNPDLPQIVCFDTAFHAGNPPEATTFALPEHLRAKGLRRYGFHGLSYASLVRRFTDITGQPRPNRLLAFHLGAGASIAAILNGKGVATTMGFSPLDGLTMATRAGSLDPGLLLYLLQHEGMSAAEIDHMLNHQSGLTALAGSPDMKSLLQSNTHEAKFAVSHFIYWAARHAGSMIAAMQGVDGIVFTGGIGENAEPIRAGILDRLRWTRLNPTRQVWVIPADEEGEIVQMVSGFL